MPKNTKVEQVYNALKSAGKDQGAAARIAQAQTGLALKTGKPPKKKQPTKQPKPQAPPVPQQALPY